MYQIIFSTNRPEKAKNGWESTRVTFPIAPSEITTKIAGMNKTIDLINESEVNQIKGLKLTEYSFDLRLPNQRYPFAVYDGDIYQSADYFLEKLESFKTKNIPFKLKIVRKQNNGVAMYDTEDDVTLESYDIKESSDDGTDVTVSVSLKSYRKYGTIKIKVKKAKTFKYRKLKVSYTKKKIVKAYATKNGDTLHNISIKVYGTYTESNAKAIYQKNKAKLDKALEKTFKKKYTKRVLVASLPKSIKLSIPQKG